MPDLLGLTKFICLGLGFSAMSLAATTKIITLNTSSLVGHPAAPFSIAFQLTDGSAVGDANNTVTISGFQFGGGQASGSPVIQGGTTGSLASKVTLTDSAFENYLVQPFVPGAALTFTVSVTGNVDSGPIPDRFSFSILDSSGAEIPTLGGENFDQFLTVVISTSNPLFEIFKGDPFRTPLAGGGEIILPEPALVEDTSPPTLSVVLSPTSLWPPNHQLVQVNATIQVSDSLDPSPRVELVSVASNEADNGLGDGDTVNDIQGAAPGTDDRSFQLRAERSGAGNGRVYTIVYRATDASGNTSMVTKQVTVSH